MIIRKVLANKPGLFCLKAIGYDKATCVSQLRHLDLM
jgi:hypothetical protein